MQFDHVPLLGIARQLYGLPLGMERFYTYLRTMIGQGGADGKGIDLLPLVAMNPMGKTHLNELLDHLLVLDAEDVARQAEVEAERRLRNVPGHYRVGLVLCDDLRGGGTHHYLMEMNLLPAKRPRSAENWLPIPLWASEAPSAFSVREAVLKGIFRQACVVCLEPARTLGERLRQEGLVLSFAGVSDVELDAADLEYTREVLRSLLDSTDVPTLFAALYGDEAARSVGYAPLGLSPGAGLALALAEERALGRFPETVFQVA